MNRKFSYFLYISLVVLCFYLIQTYKLVRRDAADVFSDHFSTKQGVVSESPEGPSTASLNSKRPPYMVPAAVINVPPDLSNLAKMFFFF